MGVLATGKDVKWAAKQDSMEPTWPCSKIGGFVMNRTIRERLSSYGAKYYQSLSLHRSRAAAFRPTRDIAPDSRKQSSRSPIPLSGRRGRFPALACRSRT